MKENKLLYLVVVLLVIVIGLLVFRDGGSEPQVPAASVETPAPKPEALPRPVEHVHTWREADCRTERFCVDCGLSSGSPLGHDWAPATYDAPRTCRTCGITEGSPKKRILVSAPVSYATASSTYSADQATHGASNLLDGKLDTNWTEGVEGNGEWEYVEFFFTGEYLITGMTIHSGNHASAASYEQNARPYRIELMFSDGTFMYYNLMDKMVQQTITFDQSVVADSVRLSIESVYEGSKYEDTVISEVSFEAYE